uniref:D-isomer specific 2-hydroxyacid dehydrogenase NAD-binding domain-containing protein n=1 Tax=Bionectria ochroleuca TaxID=29856 RepID=A0A8H7K9T7_BIOOC
MTLIKLSSGSDLKGHKLVLYAPRPTPPEAVAHLKAKFPGLEIAVYHKQFFDTDPYQDISREEWKNVTILVTGSMIPDPEAVPKLQYVQLFSAGANHVVNKPLFQETDVALCTANGVHGPQIAEWVISTFLAHQHQIPRYLEQQREEKWSRADEEETEDAVGRTVGILGYGSIGRQVARVAKALGMNIHAFTNHPRNTPESRRDESYTPEGLGDPEGIFPSKWFSGDLHTFLSSGLDLLVISVPLTPKTHHLLGQAEFQALAGRRTFVSNIARGPIVKTDDLIEALDAGTIRGAALDVTDPEPLPTGHPLWKAKNVIITPHASGASTAYYERVLKILELNLGRLSRGEELTNKVDRKEGY